MHAQRLKRAAFGLGENAMARLFVSNAITEVLRRRQRLIMTAAAGVSLAAGATSARAEFFWVNRTGNWSVNSNWGDGVGDQPPASGGSAVDLEFYTDNTLPTYVGSYTSTNNLANPYNLHSLSFFSFSPGDITIAGSRLNFMGTNPFIGVLWTDGHESITAPISLAVTTTITNSDTTNTYDGTILLLTGGVTGAGGLNLTGGSVYLTGTNTYAGTTTITGGSLFAGSTNALSPNSTYSLSDFGQLFFEVPDPVTVNGTTIAAGSYSQTIGGITGSGLISLGASTLTVGGNNASTTFDGVIAGDFGSAVNKVGTGSILFNGNVSVDQLNINAGSVRIGDNFSLSGTSVKIAVNNGLDINGLDGPTIGVLSGSGNLDITGAAFTTDAFDNSTYSGILSGSGILVKNGPGTLALTAVNTYSGGTQINAGALLINADSGLGSVGTAVAFSGNGTLQFGGTFNLGNTRPITINSFGAIDTQGFNTTISQAIGETDLASVLAKMGTGALTLSGSNTFTGGLQIVQGSVVLANANAAGTAGTIELNGDDTLASNTALILNPNLTLARDIHVNNQGTGVATIGSAAGTTGAAIFSGALTLDRDVTISAGNTTANDTTNNPGQTRFDGAISGIGGMNVTGGHMVQFRTGAKTYSGQTHLVGTGTTLSIKNTSASPSNSTINLDAGTSVVLEGLGNAIIGGLTGTGTVSNNPNAGVSSIKVGNNNASATFAGHISGAVAFEKVGTGTTVFASENFYSGPTTLTAGVLSVAMGNELGDFSAGNSLIFNGGTLQTTSSISTSRVVTVNSTGGAVDTAGKTFSLSGSANSNFSGNLTVTGGGTVALARTGGTLTVNPGATVTITSGATLNLASTIEALSAGTNRANIINNSTGGLKVSAGTQNLGTVDGTGNASVDAGTSLIVDHLRGGALDVNGTLRVRASGADANVTVVTNLSIGASGALDLNNNDLIVDYPVAGPSPFITLRNWVLQGYAPEPTAGKTGIITTVGQSLGNTLLALFENSAANLPSFDGVTLDSTSIVGKYTYHGDTNLDGMVDASDYTAIFQNLGAVVAPGIGWLKGDMDFDGIVTPRDLSAVDANMGSGVGHPLAALGMAAVPEPGTLGLLLGAGVLGMRRRRR
jgi:fibronectin-binding autotransporter adhesin